MRFLIYFIGGIIFITILSPILEAFGNIVLTFIEMIKGKMAIKIAEYNYQISQIGEEPQQDLHVIGFSAPMGEEDYDEED